MTRKSTEDVPEGDKDADAVETETSPAEETEAKPKRRRRVRVIEVLDDEDIDEVLEAIEAEESEAAKETKQSKATRPKTTEAAPAKRVEAVDEDEETKGDSEPESTPRKPKNVVSLDEAAPRPFLGLGRNQAIVVVLVVAVLASLAVWQWRTATALSNEADERAAVAKVASAYGDVALNYNASNYQSQMKKAQALMGGDLLDSFKATTLPNLGNTFKSSPQLVLTSKTDQVFVGNVDGRFATATISVDVSVTTAEGPANAPATLIRLAMAKIDGAWKVTKMYASGVNDQNLNQQGGGLPSVPTSPAPSKSPTDKEKPKE